jgi:dTDP-4-dehydrorhamnose reductase
MLGSAIENVCKNSGINHIGFSHSGLEISNIENLEQKIKENNPEIIINTAAMMGIPVCEENPTKAFEINALSVLNLAKICKKSNIKLIQISTNSVFDGKKGDLYFETDIPNPLNIYGLSKYAGEICVQNNLDNYYIIRLPKLFGPRKNNTLGFTDKIIDKMKKGGELRIAEDRFEPFTYSEHAARKIISIVQDKMPYGIYHITNRESISFYDFVCRFAEKIGYKGKITKAKDKDFYSQGYSPLRTELGSYKITDMPNIEKGLEEYVENNKNSLIF